MAAQPHHEKVSTLEGSLMSQGVKSMKAFVLQWMNAQLIPKSDRSPGRGAPPEMRIQEIQGPRSGLRDGVVLADLWKQLSGVSIDCDRSPASEIQEKTNLWTVLSALEEGGVKPLMESHFWDASGIHNGDFLPSLQLCIALAAHQGMKLPPDVYYFTDGEDGSVVPHSLTPVTHCSPRLSPSIIFKVASCLRCCQTCFYAACRWLPMVRTPVSNSLRVEKAQPWVVWERTVRCRLTMIRFLVRPQRIWSFESYGTISRGTL